MRNCHLNFNIELKIPTGNVITSSPTPLQRLHGTRPAPEGGGRGARIPCSHSARVTARRRLLCYEDAKEWLRLEASQPKLAIQ